MEDSLNVYGKPLEICGKDPITGAFRDGFCNTGRVILENTLCVQ